MVCDLGVIGQPRNVEPEVCNVGKTVLGAAVLHQSVDSREKLRQ